MNLLTFNIGGQSMDVSANMNEPNISGSYLIYKSPSQNIPLRRPTRPQSARYTDAPTQEKPPKNDSHTTKRNKKINSSLLFHGIG
jgi:hypothetical protein